MNMYLFELKQNRKFAINWFLIIIVLFLFLLSFYPIFNKEMDDFISIINNLPESMKIAFGFNPDTIGSILGYYAFALIFIYLCAAIESMILGLSGLSKEIRMKTADFLLSKPVSRSRIVTSKILSSITIIFISTFIYFILFYIGLLVFSSSSFSFETYLLLTGTILFISIIFFSIGTLLSVIIPRIKAITSLSLGLVFGLYLLSTFGDDKLRFILPFKYFDATNILLGKGYEFKYVLISFFVVLISIIGTYLIYNKNDIHTV